MNAICVTCGRELQDGDRYIEDTSSGFLGHAAESAVDDLMADIFGSADGRVYICEACTEEGGKYGLRTFSRAAGTGGTE